jgi:ligand-binding sensor domain-containing protein
MKKNQLLFLLLNMWATTLLGQQYSYVQYNVKEGLVQSQVRCLLQDSRGFIWAGTLGGLSRFDGREFVNYDRRNGLPGNQVNCLHELENGVIAVGCNGNIALVYSQKVETISLGTPWSNATINSIWGKSRDLLYVGTEEGVFCHSKRQSERTIRTFHE